MGIYITGINLAINLVMKANHAIKAKLVTQASHAIKLAMKANHAIKAKLATRESHAIKLVTKVKQIRLKDLAQSIKK